MPTTTFVETLQSTKNILKFGEAPHCSFKYLTADKLSEMCFSLPEFL